MTLAIVSRSQWRALPPKEEKTLKLPTKDISFVFTGGNSCKGRRECVQELQRLQQEAMDKGLPDIEYNFMIGGDLRIYRGRGWRTEVKEDVLLVGYLGSSRGEKGSVWKMVDKGYDLLFYALLSGKAEAIHKKPEGDIDIASEERHVLLEGLNKFSDLE